MSVVIDSASRSYALTLVDERSSRLEAAGNKASAEFFDGGRSADLWLLSVEAIGDLAELRYRLERKIPLNAAQRNILLDLIAAPSSAAESKNLCEALQTK